MVTLTVDTDQIVHTARCFSAYLPPIQCTLSGHITPISYPNNFKNHIQKEDVLAIEIVDTPENIFERLVFSDVNDIIYKDDEYKNAWKEHYITEIFEDLVWYGNINKGLGIINRIDVKNESPNQVAERIIHEFVKTNDEHRFEW